MILILRPITVTSNHSSATSGLINQSPPKPSCDDSSLPLTSLCFDEPSQIPPDRFRVDFPDATLCFLSNMNKADPPPVLAINRKTPLIPLFLMKVRNLEIGSELAKRPWFAFNVRRPEQG